LRVIVPPFFTECWSLNKTDFFLITTHCPSIDFGAVRSQNWNKMVF
jgi:hypothetical protein